MATTRALLATAEAITNTELTVTSALAKHIKVFLPLVADGAGATVAEGRSISITQGVVGGSITVLTNLGARVVVVFPGETVSVTAMGDASFSSWTAVIAPGTIGASDLAATGTQVASMRTVIKVTNTADPPSLAAGLEQFWTVINGEALGVQFGDKVDVTWDVDIKFSIIWAYVLLPDQIRFVQSNPTTGALDVASTTMTALVSRPVGTLPAGASQSPTSWLRTVRPNGTIGLSPMWDEVDGQS